MVPTPELGLPAVHRDPSLPSAVQIYEVGPRDGLQAERGIVPTDAKVRFIQELRSAGLRRIEVTSFVPPSWIPQLADAADVLAALGPDLTGYPVLVPNVRGLESAITAGVREAAVFVSATETFARRNLNRGRDEAIDMAVVTAESARTAGLTVRGYVSMCFGDPWEGAVDLDAVVSSSRALIDAGCAQVSLGDTIGVGTAGHVVRLIDAHDAAGIPPELLALHFHDTYGQALANVLAGLQVGVTCFDSSAGGLGGCPFAGSATGNLATEDLVWMLNGLGIETGVDLQAVVSSGRRMREVIGKTTSSRVGAALG